MADTLDEEIEQVETVEEVPTETAPDAAPDEGESEAAPAERTDRGDGRDATGKFVGKPGEEPPVDVTSPTADAVAPNAEPVAAQPATEAPVEARPFAVKALGQEYTVDGSTIQPDGSVVFTPEAAQALHRNFGRAILLAQRENETRAMKQQVRAEKAATEAYYKPIETQWEALKGAQSLEEFQEIAAGMWLNREIIDKERELAKREVLLTAPQEVSPDEQREAVERDLDNEIGAHARALQKADWAKGLTVADWREIEDDMRAVRTSFVVQNQEGLFYDHPRAAEFVQRQAVRILRERGRASATSQAATVAARKNAAAGVTAVNAPPGVGTGTPAARPAQPKPLQPSKALTPEERKAQRQAELDEYRRWRDGEDLNT